MQIKRPIVLFLTVILPALTLLAQPDRISQPVDRSRMSAVRGNIPANARRQYDQGPADPSLEMANITVMFQPSGTQQAGLEQLLASQKNAGSPDYRKWLTPDQYADRFGLSQGDIAKVAEWLRAEGLTVSVIANGRQWITFAGTAGGVARALGTEIHRYRVEGELRYANVNAPSVPEAFAGIVAGFHGLDNLPERSPHQTIPVDSPAYDNAAGSHFLAPDDFATIYNVDALYRAGIDGTGQKIAIVGRTDINLADIRTFRARFNLAPNDPQVVLTGPDPGTNPSDLAEADLDLEWSGAVARNATLIYVNSTSVQTSAQYAIDNNLAPVMSSSYGLCEQETTPAFRSVAQQAAAQGITWMNASGDSGAADCDAAFSGQQASKGLAVNFPASIPEVTAVGGTMFNEAAGSYWASSNGPNLGSALSYIPEVAWNEDSPAGLASGGGGASIFFPKPSWQAGPGVPSDGARDVPDVALSASAHDGYLLTSGGNSELVVFGTSAASPSFAGIVALVNQYLLGNGLLSQPGLGNINPELYRLAQNTPGVFHDVTTGGNVTPCEQESPNCVNGFMGYNAASGYDQATGLGSVDAYALATNFSATTGTTATMLTTNVSSLDLNGTLSLTATVSATGGGLSGTVGFIVANSAIALGSVALVVSGGTGIATLTVPADLLPAGNDTVAAVYSGNSGLNGSSGTATVMVTVPSAGSVVVASITPNPVYQRPPNALGERWIFSVNLTEVAGVATTLTGFTQNGRSLPLSSYFLTSNIPANGTLSATGLGYGTLTVPQTIIFGFIGMDANGRTWSQQVSVLFNGPGVETPLMLLSSATGPVQQNPAAAASCQWQQSVFLQEQGGFAVQLTSLAAGATNLSSQIQEIFGTTRLAPFGMLQGSICWSGVAPPQSQGAFLIGTADNGEVVAASLATSFGAAAPTVSNASVSPAAVSLSIPSSPSQTLALNFDAGAPPWTVSVFPSGSATSWLQVTPLTGSGPAQLSLKASPAGLSNGVYNATLLIQSANAVPEYISVPVSLTLGASSTTTIGGVSNVFTGQVAFAPGMLASVYGVQLAPSIQSASSLPLPLSMQGVSATVNGISAPIWDILPGQLNIQIPYETGAGPAVLGVNNNGEIASFPLSVSPSAPGAWPAFQTTLGSVVNTAKQGTILVTYITGEGDVTPSLADGATPLLGTPVTGLPKPTLPLTVTVGGVPATVLFAGIPSGLTGVTQIDFTVPANAPLGSQPVVVSVGGVPAAAVNLTVLPL